jgi:hypothetical protein
MPLGSAITDARGRFQIAVDAALLRTVSADPRPDLFFKVFLGSSLIRSTEDSILRNVGTSRTGVVIEVDLPGKAGIEDERPLEGRYRFVGRLVSQDTQRPLPDLVVHALDLDAGPRPVDLGFDLTDSQGRFAVVYRLSAAPSDGEPGEVEARRRLRLRILDQRRRQIHQTEIRTGGRPGEIFDVLVPPPVATPTPSIGLIEVARVLRGKVRPTRLQAILGDLSRRGIRTLEDIRRHGGLQHLQDLAVPADDPAVALLEAHADLGAISSDVRLNASLIQKGFPSVATLARAPRARVVAAAREQVGDFKAAQLHVVASARTRFLGHVLMGLMADRANGFALRIPGVGNPHLPEWFDVRCECTDCESAVSPLAYLADLLDYAVNNLSLDGEPVTVTTLTDMFHQPFDRLSARCSAQEEQVRQVRLGVEVLRAFRGSNQPLPEDRQQEYCLAAYESLLARIGTSDQELRLARIADDETRRSLAQRLGLDPNHTEHLAALTLASEEVTERALERLFGLRDTTRDPLGPAPAGGPDLLAWRREALRALWKQQDWPIDPYTADFEPSEERLPLIDPDLIGPADFRYPEAKAAGSPDGPFDVWLRRREWVDSRLVELVGQGAPDLSTMLDRMSREVAYPTSQPEWNVTPWPQNVALDELFERVTQGTVDKVRAAHASIQRDLRLTVEGFQRLMAIRAKDQASALDPAIERVTDEEWSDVRSILVRAQQAALFPAWREEETRAEGAQDAGVWFGPKAFWMALSEPKEGEWPPREVPGRPWIDPDTVGREDLPEERFGQRAHDLWDERRREFDDHVTVLKGVWRQDGLEALLKRELDSLLDRDLELAWIREQMTLLDRQLNSHDQAEVDAATVRITTELHTTVEAFRRLVAAWRKEQDPDPARRATPEERDEVCVILTRAAKEGRWLADWRDVEDAESLTTQYWRALKARLPRWRASVQARQAWQSALRTRSGQPIIDPDVLVDGGHLRDDGPDAARRLRRERWIWLNGVDGLQDRLGRTAQPQPTLAELDAILQGTLGIPPAELVELGQQADRGANIRARLEQLTLTPDGFRYLLRIRAILEGLQPVRPEEWQGVVAILVAVTKRREFADWRTAEREPNNNVLLGPDLFKMPERPAGDFPDSAPPAPPAWRATLRDLREWEQTLEGRIAQDVAVAEGLRAAVSATEEATLPLLRRHLIEDTRVRDAAGVLVTGVRAKTDVLGHRLLIDMRADGCQLTTRAAQAIETLQGLPWGLRTGQLRESHPDLRLDDQDFDARWAWIGSYPPWRAAMFVFLYPENILLPSLRRRQSPAFRKIVADLRGQRQLTPRQACDAAAAYYTYFHDVSTLKLEASRDALTRLHVEDTCGPGKATIYVPRCHLFARPASGGRVYWSVYDLEDTSGYPQTFWEPVPGLGAVDRLIGTQPYVISDQERFLYLFAAAHAGDEPRLLFARYDLEHGGWAGEPKELDLPEPADGATTTFEASIGDPAAEGRAPLLRLRTRDGLLYERRLNAEGTDWAEGDWQARDRLWGQWTEVTGANSPDLPAGAPVTAVAREGGQVHLFAVDRGGRVRTTSLEIGGQTAPWEPLSAEAHPFPLGSIVSAVAPGPDQLAIFGVRDTDVWRRRWAQGAGWQDWENISAQAGDVRDSAIVTAVPRDANPALYLVGDNGNIYWRVIGDWERLEGHVPLESEIEALVWPAVDHVLLFASGNDGGVRVNAFDEDRYIGGVTFERGSAVTALARSDTDVELFAVDPDGAVQVTRAETPGDVDSWRSWTVVENAGEIGFPPGAKLTAVTDSDGHAHLFGIGDDGGVYGTWSTDPGVWHSWVRIGGHRFSAGSRIAAVQSGDQIQLFVVDGDGRVQTNVCRDLDAATLISADCPSADTLRPSVTGPFSIFPSSSAALQAWRDQIRHAFQANEPGSRSNVAYLEEAYYFVPVHLAMALMAAGQYVDALDWFRTVYDYGALIRDRKISWILGREEDDLVEFERAEDWLLDPLDPHAIAAGRGGTYTRFTLLTLVQCFLAYADAEFTRDTAEATAWARVLYTTALELLELPELRQKPDRCGDSLEELWDGLAGELREHVRDPRWDLWAPGLNGLRNGLARLMPNIREGRFQGLIDAVQREILGDPSKLFEDRLNDARRLVEAELAEPRDELTLGGVLEGRRDGLARAAAKLLSYDAIAGAADRLGVAASAEYLRAVSAVAGVAPIHLGNGKAELPWLGRMMSGTTDASMLAPGSGPVGTPVWEEYERVTAFVPNRPTRMFALGHWARGNPGDALGVIRPDRFRLAGDPPLPFCVPPNPVLQALRLHAELNLHKLRTCRNIAGMERQLEPYAAPTDAVSGLPTIGAGGQLVLPGAVTLRPTPYRYAVLVERAKHLANLAAQFEASMLSAIEKHDAEAYTVLRARQDLRLAEAGVTLQDLRAREAENGVKLAELQRQRAQIEFETYDEWINAGKSVLEQLTIALLGAAIGAHLAAAAFPGGAASFAASISTGAEIASALASFERREQQWKLQRSIAEQDMLIGGQQVSLAEDHVRVVGQERLIAKRQAEHAADTAAFLAGKFTSADLYDWMSRVLEDVYRFFLQQATATAQLAAAQLAFERQEAPPPYIQADYWEAPNTGDLGGATDGATAPDRRGLTGSARLLRDIYQLDQYAFETDKRKLHLAKTLSLARLAPAEFQRFRETGVMPFETTLEMFDRDFPGHYLRLIRRVRVSVIALVPPALGIRATLSSSGISRVVLPGGTFQTSLLRRDPELVALTSPREATGVFELDPQPEMRLPFEGLGVATRWELRMPRAANPFDYGSVADVLVTIEHTALHSFDYQRQVLQALNPNLSADRAYSFRHQFADQWYDLHNPDQTATPMAVRFKTVRADFPPNLDDLRIKEIVLCVARAAGQTFPVTVTRLQFTPEGSAGAIGGGATSSDGLMSTRAGNAGSWTAMVGTVPFGTWELAFPNSQEMKDRFSQELIDDILLVITYSGRAPEWPA